MHAHGSSQPPKALSYTAALLCKQVRNAVGQGASNCDYGVLPGYLSFNVMNPAGSRWKVRGCCSPSLLGARRLPAPSSAPGARVNWAHLPLLLHSSTAGLTRMQRLQGCGQHPRDTNMTRMWGQTAWPAAGACASQPYCAANGCSKLEHADLTTTPAIQKRRHTPQACIHGWCLLCAGYLLPGDAACLVTPYPVRS